MPHSLLSPDTTSMKLMHCAVILILLGGCSAQSETEESSDESIPSSAVDAATPSPADEESSGQPSASRSTGAPARAQLAVYQGATYQHVLAASSVAGSELDGEIALGYAEEICGLDLDRTGADARSIEDLRSFKASFCVDRHGKADIGDRHTIIERWASDGNVEAGVLNLALNASDELTAEERGQISEELTAVSAATESPYVFYTANELLYSEPLYDPSLDQNRPPGMTDEMLQAVRQYGVVLAGCQRFNHCGPNSLMAKRFCMPTQCAPGQDVRAFVRRQLPEPVYLEAVKFSRELARNNRS